MKKENIGLILVVVIIIFLVIAWMMLLGDLHLLKKDINSQKRVIDFEKRLNNYYPLADDRFYIDHGEDYFAFFERLGELYYMAKIDSRQRIVGTVACVLRSIQLLDPLFFNPLQKRIKVWYIGDLKLDPKYRNQRFPFKLFFKYGMQFWSKSSRVYAISMDSGSKPNRILKLVQKIPFGDFKSGGKLYIYTINYKELKTIDQILKRYFGPYHFVNLANIKDLILESTGRKMNIKHLVRDCYSKNKNSSMRISRKRSQNLFMFCVHSSNGLVETLKKAGITTNTSATIIHRQMDNTDWNFINTSEL